MVTRQQCCQQLFPFHVIKDVFVSFPLLCVGGAACLFCGCCFKPISLSLLSLLRINAPKRAQPQNHGPRSISKEYFPYFLPVCRMQGENNPTSLEPSALISHKAITILLFQHLMSVAWIPLKGIFSICSRPSSRLISKRIMIDQNNALNTKNNTNTQTEFSWNAVIYYSPESRYRMHT